MSMDSIVTALVEALKGRGIELSEAERRLIASASQWPGPMCEIASSVFAGNMSEKALAAHAEALLKAAASSDRATRRLACATWALVAFTGALAVATVGTLWFRGAGR